jgi:hypothetical protein
LILIFSNSPLLSSRSPSLLFLLLFPFFQIHIYLLFVQFTPLFSSDLQTLEAKAKKRRRREEKRVKRRRTSSGRRPIKFFTKFPLFENPLNFF